MTLQNARFSARGKVSGGLALIISARPLAELSLAREASHFLVGEETLIPKRY